MVDVADLKQKYGKHGWFLSVGTQGDSRDGIWENYEDFISDMRKIETGGRELIWRGKHHRPTEGRPPKTGEGFAVYFNSHNPPDYKNRVVLVGKMIVDKWDAVPPPGRRRHQIRFDYSIEVLDALKTKALVKNDSNKDLFISSGIKPGVVATFYHIAPRHWDALLAEVSTKL